MKRGTDLNFKSPAPENFSWWDIPKSIWYFLEEDKKKFAICAVLLFPLFFYDLVPAYVVGKIIDFLTKYKEGQSLSDFYFYILFVTVTWFLVSLFRLQCRNIINVIGSKARARARIWGFERLTEFSLEWHRKENTGNKLQRLFTGADAIVKGLRTFRADLVKIFANTIGMVGIFLFADYRLVLLVVIYVTLFLFIEYIYGRQVFRLSNEFNRLNQNAGGALTESANNMLSVKALGGEHGMIDKVSNKEIISRDVSIKKAKVFAVKWRFFHVINSLSLALFLYIVGSGVVNNTISIGMVLVFYTYFSKLQGYLTDVSELYMDLIELRSDLGNMMPIFRETDFIKTGKEHFPRDWKSVVLNDAEMEYGSGQIGLSHLSLVLKRNTKTGVAGLSGSGKSTLAKVILGLYALKSGELKIGEKDYYSISHNETLSNITVVLQETELFNLSLRENITMMRGEDVELLNKAVEISQLGPVVERLAPPESRRGEPEGLDARIGEKGYMLSGGERQRLGIARAIYKNAPIVIMDEATSALDSETEGKIMEKLLGEYGVDKTFLIIAHRLGTLKYTDNIAVMERGSVIEEGNYEELLNNPSSAFYHMNQKYDKKND